MSKKILFFGNERLATGVATTAPTLQALIAAGYEVAAVVVAQQPTAKSRKERPLEVAALAERYSIPLLAPTRLADAQAELASFGAQAAVLVAFGKILPAVILSLFPRGIINIHPSRLPEHRGSTPLETVILEGATSSAVSLIQLSHKMDAGPLFAQQTVELTGTESKQALADRLSLIGSQLLLQTLPAILDGSLLAAPQADALATYDPLISKEDGVLDWAKPATRLEREIRAYAGWPRSRAVISQINVIITGARTGAASGVPGSLWLEEPGQLGIYTADGVLIIDRLIPAGKPEMSAAAFLAGYRPKK